MASGSSARKDREERLEKVAALQAAQDRAERRRRAILVGVIALVVLVLAVPTALVVLDAQRENASVEEAAAEPIEGEETQEVPSAAHVTGDVPEDQVVVREAEGGALPPIGGDHDPVWQNCGYYAEPVRVENAVHSLEHGAVWVTYQPDLAEEQVAQLRELAAQESYLLVSPYEGLAAPVVATAWGVQLELESVSDERLPAFLERYLQGEQTPEPGAACQGGVGG
ncbi:hypothetical protein N866_14330 [Actinotalea ferrariae CF5-4]|uniref:DUF3105 domain-containing protein n=1 Tax=Actinotalea ferrariae CF5-4 TaxID=948458 RepID=A0A021VL73_9CELL|nr:DUF3105 domain-containing protein [Actinotalea ferrariae]EYR61911.1 hypothetical protein N866_14330 [Actinotalea ferrariae CF5-4]